MTNEIPKDKLKCAIVVKNTSSRPMTEVDLMEDEEVDPLKELNLPSNYYMTSLIENVPSTIGIALDDKVAQMKDVEFEFIPKEEERVKGVTLAKGLNLDFVDE